MGEETQPEWVKSSLSYANGNCVEVASLPGGHVAVRNSREPDGPVLRFTREEWQAFIGGARNGEFDDFGGGGTAGDGDPHYERSRRAVALGEAGEDEDAQDARDMAAGDGDHDRCEPGL